MSKRLEQNKWLVGEDLECNNPGLSESRGLICVTFPAGD